MTEQEAQILRSKVGEVVREFLKDKKCERCGEAPATAILHHNPEILALCAKCLELSIDDSRPEYSDGCPFCPTTILVN